MTDLYDFTELQPKPSKTGNMYNILLNAPRPLTAREASLAYSRMYEEMDSKEATVLLRQATRRKSNAVIMDSSVRPALYSV